MTQQELQSLIELRKTLHSNPELSGKEPETAEKISAILKECNADELHRNVGGDGVLATFKAGNPQAKQTLLFRAELDAVAIEEETGLDFSSENPGKMHACGHDGHMVILLGFARYLKNHRPENARIILLFQPAEETGEGAGRVLQDERFKTLRPDQAFALHNLPGFPENSICIRNGPFACASAGMDILFEGKFSHAAYPEHGINPSDAVGFFLREVTKERETFRERNELNKMTTTFLKMGEPAFGISPGKARVGITVRAATDQELEEGIQQVEKALNRTRKMFSGKISWQEKEPFTATINHDEGVAAVKQAAQINNLSMVDLDTPFSWSEDFGEFRKACPVTLFGLGAGENSPPLHSEKYDFNDNLISTGISMFAEIMKLVSRSASPYGKSPNNK